MQQIWSINFSPDLTVYGNVGKQPTERIVVRTPIGTYPLLKSEIFYLEFDRVNVVITAFSRGRSSDGKYQKHMEIRVGKTAVESDQLMNFVSNWFCDALGAVCLGSVSGAAVAASGPAASGGYTYGLAPSLTPTVPARI